MALNIILKKSEIGTIKKRYSRTLHESYTSNGCYYCDSLQGDYFIKEELLEYQIHDEVPDADFVLKIKYSEIVKFHGEEIVFAAK